MNRKITLVSFALLVVASLFAVSTPASATFSGGAFFVQCTFVRDKNVDPIVSPGVLSSHDHMFFGTRVGRFTASTRSLQPHASNCSDSHDHSGYWAPVMRDKVSGQLMTPQNANVYYLAGGTKRQTIPDNTKLVSTDVVYNCGAGTPFSATPFKCGAGEGPRFIVRFNSPNDTLPDVRVDYRFTQSEYQGYDMRNWATTSDMMMPRHGDFLFGWDRARFDQLVATCLNTLTGTCGEVKG